MIQEDPENAHRGPERSGTSIEVQEWFRNAQNSNASNHPKNSIIA
jgi:hypothetical protein